MDTYQGNGYDPITLHKYLYANANPVMFTDPTGNFGLASMSAANSIASVLHDIQINIGMNILDSAFNPDSAGSGVLLGGLATMGPSAFKLLRVLSGKFRKLCNSFDGDTLVSTEFGLRTIRDINIGDKVWAYNEETGEKSLQEVVHLIQTEGTKELVDVQVMGGEVITATAEHPFYLANTNEWAFAKDLSLESLLQNIDGEWIGIEGVAQYEETHKVYNLTVNNDHTYFVGEGQVLAHNASVCRFPRQFRWDHVFYGNFNGRRFGGFHHNPQGMVPSGRLIELTGKKSGGFYEAIVYAERTSGRYVRKAANGGKSTFFPDSWTQEKIKNIVNAALIKTKGKTGLVAYRDITSQNLKGVYIRVVVRGEELITAYPVLK